VACKETYCRRLCSLTRPWGIPVRHHHRHGGPLVALIGSLNARRGEHGFANSEHEPLRVQMPLILPASFQGRAVRLHHLRFDESRCGPFLFGSAGSRNPAVAMFTGLREQIKPHDPCRWQRSSW